MYSLPTDVHHAVELVGELLELVNSLKITNPEIDIHLSYVTWLDEKLNKKKWTAIRLETCGADKQLFIAEALAFIEKKLGEKNNKSIKTY